MGLNVTFNMIENLICLFVRLRMSLYVLCIYLKPKVTLHCQYIYLFWVLVSDILNVFDSY